MEDDSVRRENERGVCRRASGIPESIRLLAHHSAQSPEPAYGFGSCGFPQTALHLRDSWVARCKAIHVRLLQVQSLALKPGWDGRFATSESPSPLHMLQNGSQESNPYQPPWEEEQEGYYDTMNSHAILSSWLLSFESATQSESSPARAFSETNRGAWTSLSAGPVIGGVQPRFISAGRELLEGPEDESVRRFGNTVEGGRSDSLRSASMS